MSEIESKDKRLIGAAGEYLVLSRLLSREKLSSLAPIGASTADILVNPVDNGKPVLVQVKTTTRSGKNPSWPMGEKHEMAAREHLFFCFVHMPKDELPVVYVIPSKKVAEVVSESHSTWLKGETKNGRKRNDSKMRQIKNTYSFEVKGAPPGWMEKYLEAWNLLD